MKRRPGCPGDLLPEEDAAIQSGSVPENRQGANKITLAGARDPTLGLKRTSFGGKGTNPPWVRGRQCNAALAA